MNISDSNEKRKNYRSKKVQKEASDLTTHWNKIYNDISEEKLGWYESDLYPTLNLIAKTNLKKTARILNVGAGSTTLIDKLLQLGYSNLIATDLSEVALSQLKKRVDSKDVHYIIDDLTQPKQLKKIPPVNLWIDRAVLHFFTNTKDQNTYFNLLNKKIATNGFALIAEFNLQGASFCSGLPVLRYSKEILIKKLKNNFDLIAHFDHTYIMPSGEERPYIYTLFKKSGK